ncbi:MAG: response regulator [Sphingomonas phyllosphaerae]|uniref:sigma-54-dependent transcriptional regulator n=1 Tax=Sphingomonas phyllosphaerae TaxID=257003 RepID=UPI002FF616EF
MVSVDGQSQHVSRPATILLVDDNPAVARAMEIAFRLAGHRLDTATGPEEAFSRLALARYDAILLDMNFGPNESSGEEGLACLARIMADDPAACVVVITAHSGIRIAVAAMQAGARDFAMKPWRNAELVAKVEAAIARGRTAAPAVPAAAPAPTGEPPAHLLGDSAAMHGLRDLVRRIGPVPAGVTITGRPGSGRTLTALAIHAASPRAATAPARVDLRDMDAWSRLDGASGTAILRHPDVLDPVAQTRLLDRIPADLRCIAIADSTAPFLPALRRRLATVEVAVPPLRDRDDDAILLARHFARTAAERFGRPQARLTGAAETAIRAAAWPDEVRGLALAVERAVLLSNDGVIDAAALAPPAPVVPTPTEATPDIRFDLTDAERAMIEAALREHRHNVTHAATALGLSRGALYRRMARYGL